MHDPDIPWTNSSPWRSKGSRDGRTTGSDPSSGSSSRTVIRTLKTQLTHVPCVRPLYESESPRVVVSVTSMNLWLHRYSR